MSARVTCNYCGHDAQRVTGRLVYPHRPDLAEKRFWRCKPCDAYVGCHPSGRPLGRLANASLRAAKVRAHAAFDPLWKDGTLSRTQAYHALARALNLHPAACHMGMFDEAMCERVIALAPTLAQETSR